MTPHRWHVQSPCRFYNDLWEFVIPDLKWNALGRPTDTRPSPRGGCQLALHGGTLFVVGGYTASLGGEDTGKAHSDVWAWDIAAATVCALLHPCTPHCQCAQITPCRLTSLTVLITTTVITITIDVSCH